MRFAGKTFRQTEELDMAELFESQGITEYQLIAKDVPVFDMVINPLYTGGKEFDFWKFYSPTNKEHKVMATTVTGYVDDVVTELFSFSLDNEEDATVENIASAVRKACE